MSIAAGTRQDLGDPAAGVKSQSCVSMPDVAEAAAQSCAHCGEPMPGADPAKAPHFCCAGCSTVWQMLHVHGLDRYYEIARAEGQRPSKPASASMHAHLDHAAFRDQHVERLGDGRLRCEFRIDGMRCGACLWLLESMPRLESGMSSARVNLGRSTLAVEWLDGQASLSRIADRIVSLGYGLRPLGSRASREAWRIEDRAWLVKLGVAGAIASNVMAIAFALYGGEFSWMEGTLRSFLQWTSVALAGLAVAWPGSIYLRNAWAAIRTRTPHVDLPIALALLAGLLGGLWTTVRGESGIYVESVAMLVFLLLVGRFTQFRQQRRARHEVELLCALVPQVARRVVAVVERGAADGASASVTAGAAALEEVPTDALEPGDIVDVAAGDSVPADGTLEQDSAHVDTQWLTGESRPVRMVRGGAVLAGSRAIGIPLRVRVTRTGARTRAAHIAALVDRAMAERPPVVEFANRIAGWFLVAVVIAAAGAGIAWWFIDPARALPTVVAMLVVTCPCALGLATPLTMVASLGKAARAGMLVRSGEVLERLARAGTVVLDKTGTVTEGRMVVASAWSASGVSLERERQAIRCAASLEQRSMHPLARAIVLHAQGDGLALAGASDVVEHAGAGITGQVEGASVAVGSLRMMRELGVSVPDEVRAHAEAAAERGMSVAIVATGGEAVSVLGVADRVRPEAASLVAEIRRRGWDACMASGDLPEVTAEVARAIGLEPRHARGGCTPEAKLQLVRQIGTHPIIVVGDGVNDMPAMAAADVSVAVRQGTQSALDRADVALSGDGLMPIVALLDGARRTMRAVHINFAISLTYNLVGASLAATGVITPLIAAILMPLSGLTVTAVALRMPRFGEARR
jgi:Cu2+-exporting ATPase